MKTSRPFFSIIIPCYNDGRYKEGTYLDRLLSSICDQGLAKEEAEVILSDDQSPVPFDDIVDKYKDKLNLKYIKTDYNFAPGNTRAKGLTIAEGQWLCFADHDDIYYPNALSRIKTGLLETGETMYAMADFNGVKPDGTVRKKYECTMNWCHAKFYNLDNFWIPQKIHFIKDLKSHEDIAICTQVSCALSALGRNKVTYFPFPAYAWTDNPESVSHAKYTVNGVDDPRYFLEVFFADYIQSTGYIYLDCFKNHSIKMPFAIKNCIEILLYCYFYTQSFIFRRPEDYLEETLDLSAKFYKEVRITFNINIDQIYKTVADKNADMYLRIQKSAEGGCGPYIPQQTFRQWLRLLDQKADEGERQ